MRTLEGLERETRAGDDQLGRRKPHGEDVQVEGRTVKTMFEDGKWDKGKMVRSFARMATEGNVEKVEDEKVGVGYHRLCSMSLTPSLQDGKHTVYNLHPLSEAKWTKIKKQISDVAQAGPAHVPGEYEEDLGAETDASVPERSSSHNASAASNAGGVIVEAHREVRVKLYIGQVSHGLFYPG